MKRLLLNIILLFLTNSIYSQEVKYQLIVKDTCNNTEEISYYYWIFQDTTELKGKTQSFVDLINGYSILKDTGTYYLSQGYYMGIPDSNPFHKVKITEYGLTSDTILLEHIQEVNHFNYNPPWTEYLCCGGKCNGFESSYYENGNLRTQGKFYNGQPTGNLTKYYYTGELREKNTFDKNNRVFRHYDLNGQLRERFSNKRISKYPYWINKKAEYFNSTGLISMITISKRGDIKKQIKYDFEGNKVYETVRNKRIDYFKDGSVRCKLRWYKGIVQYEYCWRRFLFWKKNCLCCNEHDYIINYKEFDENGNLVLKAKFDSWDRDKYYYPDSFLDADWIRNYKKIKNNQIVKQIFNSDIKVIR